MSSSTPSLADRVIHHYPQEHALQKVSVSVNRPSNPAEENTGYWVIYIHGGAWRDPAVTLSSFDHTQSLLLQPPKSIIQEKVSTFASIEYRLSPHPNFPQHPHATPPTELRRARHPDHINDVRTAISFLQTKYGFGDRYILVGHSCGATLAFQTVMDDLPGVNLDGDAPRLIKPKAVVGVEGIYDMRLLRDNHRQYDAYREFLTGAFGPDEKLWDAASPARASSGFQRSWTEGRLAVLAHSIDDELVDFAQVDAMHDALKGWEGENEKRRVVALRDLHGLHDEIWSKGEELARVITVAVEELTTLDGGS
ncbi:conserved hypothetical protein [Paecilomyces variotii No. 5]|uniref:Kynurenine formamidase n=1 Tax=Byssochlamys spectabilis (strain No. 5 / NBRC 109023) TaxID=1356009 RepID=V5G3P5_BYSSN|nr:conserved hypothetical protein [Paecilomyces variotii No. 5]